MANERAARDDRVNYEDLFLSGLICIKIRLLYMENCRHNSSVRIPKGTKPALSISGVSFDLASAPPLQLEVHLRWWLRDLILARIFDLLEELLTALFVARE